MVKLAAELSNHAFQIWLAGLEAVRSGRLVTRFLKVDGSQLLIGDERIPLSSIRRIAVVGGGKAGAGMAEAVETVLGPQLMAEKQLIGWVNVPADCVKPLSRIHLHAARPAGVNEPRPEGVFGTQKILEIVASLGPDDLCLCLISGGGSALMPAPVDGISLADKLAVTRFLSAAGANIEQLNTVRKKLSKIKGGGLRRACRAGQLISLIISDVLGDPLDVIASGPTTPDTSTLQETLAILEHFDARSAGISQNVFDALQKTKWQHSENEQITCRVKNFIIGNNRTAVEAAASEAQRLGYDTSAESAVQSEGLAEDVGRKLAEKTWQMQFHKAPSCLISGGEPVVKLVEPSKRGLGGRNQQLTLAALIYLLEKKLPHFCLLSGGTDGEDGPTDAAGAFCDPNVIAAAEQQHLNPQDYLARNDAYNFFKPLGALIRTGPTHTNVCDLRVALVK